MPVLQRPRVPTQLLPMTGEPQMDALRNNHNISVTQRFMQDTERLWLNLGTGFVTSAMIVDGTILAADIAAGTITANEIAANTIIAGNIAAGAVDTAELAAGAVTAVKIDVLDLAAINATLGTVTSGTITTATLNGGTITGVTFRTASSGARIEMTNTDVDNISFYDTGGVRNGLIDNSGDTLEINATKSISTGHLNLVTNHASSHIGLTVNLTSVAFFNKASIDFFQDLDMNTDDILNVGNIELDSISKDGAGSISITSTLSVAATTTLRELVPDGDNTRSCGQPATRWANVYCENIDADNACIFNGVTYFWPAADGSSGDRLQTNGSGTLTWVTP